MYYYTYMILICLINYLISSIPFGLILTKIFLKKDIRQIGSGNIGATNVLRTGSKTLALFTLIFDVFKPLILPLIAFFYFIRLELGILVFISLLIDLAPFIILSSILGHMFPIYLKFKGGKGVATAFGGLFLITSWSSFGFIAPVLPIIAFLIWLFVAILFKKSSLAALISGVIILFLIPFYSLLTSFTANNSLLIMYIITYVIIYILILFKHKDNIKRLLNKTEPNINFKRK